LTSQYREKPFRRLRQEPRQRHFDAERVLQHFNAPGRSLAERAHAEAQCISLPSLLVDSDDRPEVTAGAGEAVFETADSLDLAEIMVDDSCDRFAHGNGDCLAWTCMRAIMSHNFPVRDGSDGFWPVCDRRSGRRSYCSLYVRLLSNLQRVIDLDSEVSNRALKLRMAEQ
jgi:hypothetical protein